MFFRTPPVILLGFLLLVAACDQPTLVEPESPDTEPTARSGDPIPGRYIVVLDTEALPAGKELRQSISAVASEYGVVPERLYSTTIAGFASAISEQELARIQQDHRVRYVEPDRFVVLGPITVEGPPPGKGKPGGDDGGGSSSQETPWGITRVNGGTSGAGNGTAWILDTGIDLDHPDLNVDASRGHSVFTRGKDSKLDDGHGHGTHVAGTVAALNNTTGVIGVAPGAPVVPVKVLDSRGSGTYSGVIEGIEHVAANGSSGDVANMSLGGPPSQAVDDAVSQAAASGVRFVLAAGNDADLASNYSPARVNGTGIYTISAIAQGDGFASFSNFGNPPVDFAAPGVSVLSTYKDGGYATLSGTSMATPHVAGILLLGIIQTSGSASGDPDGLPDPIASH